MWKSIGGRHYSKGRQPISDQESQFSSIGLVPSLPPFQNAELPIPIKTVPPSRQSNYTPITIKLSVPSTPRSPQITSPSTPIHAAITPHLTTQARPRSKSMGTVTRESSNYYASSPTSPREPNRNRRSQSIDDKKRFLPNFSRKYSVDINSPPTGVILLNTGSNDTGAWIGLKANNVEDRASNETPRLPTLKSKFNESW
jgi:hypothetical protein